MEVLTIEVKRLDNEILQTSIKEQLKEAYRQADSDSAYVEEEFTAFCKNQKLKGALLDSVDLLNSGEYDDIRSLIDNALKAGTDKNIGHEYNKDVETRYREDFRPTIPTPWAEINKLMGGGFGPGDLGIIFGNPGGGKSWLMVAMAAHAVKMGYNVVYYTLELGEDYVGKRFDCYLTGIDIEHINDHRIKVDTMVENLTGNLIIKEYPPKMASVATVRAHLQLKIPIISPSQVNRMGAKDDVIEGDKAAGSYDKIMVADFCMSLSRKKEDKLNGTGRLHIMKNRYGMDGMTFGALMNTNTGHVSLTENITTYEEAPPSNGNGAKAFNLMDSFDKKELSKKFSQLTQ